MTGDAGPALVSAALPLDRRAIWTLGPLIGLMLVVGAWDLQLTPIEGDDATELAFHLFGLGRPYAPYIGAATRVLSWVPAEERALWVAANVMSIFGATWFVLASLALALDWAGPKLDRRRWMGLTLVLAVPELVYAGLAFAPSMIAGALVVTSHLMLRVAARRKLARPETRAWVSWVAVSALAFGLGCGFRWPLASYGLVVAADLAFDRELRRSWLFVIWSPTALLAAWLSMAWTSGTPVLGLMELLVAGAEKPLGIKPPFGLLTLARLTSILTPASVVAAGVAFTLKEVRSRWAPILASIVASGPWWEFGTPKFLLPFVTILIFLVVAATSQMRRRVMWVWGLVAVTPWWVGFRADTGTAWGPGFEVRIPGCELGPTSTSPARFRFVVGSGVAIPSPEGPRPIGGHFWTLSADWRAFYAERDRDLLGDADRAARLGVVLSSFSDAPIRLALARRGFRHVMFDSDEVEMEDSAGRRVSIRRYAGLHPEALCDHAKALGVHAALLRTYSSAEIGRICGRSPSSMAITSPFSIEADLEFCAAESSR